MKYHINDQYEVNPCGASDSSRCPFWGKHEGDNHYSTEFEAVRTVERILDTIHPLKSKRPESAKKIKNQIETVRTNLQKFSKTSEKTLAEVSSFEEMVDKWFGGDKTKYEAFEKNIINDGLKTDTKRDVASFMNKGMTVTNESSVNNIPLEQQSSISDSKTSEITLIDEGSDKISLEELRTGKIVAFKF